MLQNQIVIVEDTVCECCKKESHFRLDIPIYCRDEVENLCPWCVADGSAAKKYNGTFVDLTFSETVNKKEFRDILSKKTPGFHSWQDNIWLAHCNDYCKFVQQVEWKDIVHLEEELNNDLSTISKDLNISKEELKELMFLESSIQTYLFQCLH